MAIPPRPTAHFILIQADLALRLFKTLFDGPSAPSHWDDGMHGCRTRSEHDVCRQLRRGAQAPPYQEPAAPLRLQRCCQGQPRPVIPAWAFGPLPSTQPVPTLRAQGGQNGFYLLWLATQPDVF